MSNQLSSYDIYKITHPKSARVVKAIAGLVFYMILAALAIWALNGLGMDFDILSFDTVWMALLIWIID